MKAERLEREFADRAVPTGSRRLLLSPADALALVNRAAEEGVPVVGVDSLRVTERAVEVPVEHAAKRAGHPGSYGSSWSVPVIVWV